MKTVDFLRCPVCMSKIFYTSEEWKCLQCLKVFSYGNMNSPDFLQDSVDVKRTFGVASNLFSLSWRLDVYSLFVKLKVLVQALLGARDSIVGAREFVSGKSVIDFGCGPNLNSNPVEPLFDVAREYVGFDSSLPFVSSASLRHQEYFFFRASATQVPVVDSSFEVSCALFTIHHIPESPLVTLAEMKRVSTQFIVIYDHVKSENRICAGIQMAYWKVFDGGYNYPRMKDWLMYFSALGIVVERQETSGIFFRHVVKFVLKLDS